MVCVPCFVIPVLLWLWHRFVQPILLRYWNPWEKKDKEGNVIKPEFPFQCAGGVCPFPKKQKIEDNEKDNDNDNKNENNENYNKNETGSNEAINIPKVPITLEVKKGN